VLWLNNQNNYNETKSTTLVALFIFLILKIINKDKNYNDMSSTTILVSKLNNQFLLYLIIYDEKRKIEASEYKASNKYANTKIIYVLIILLFSAKFVVS